MHTNPFIQQLKALSWTEEQVHLFLSKLKEKHLRPMEILHQAGKVCQFEAFVEKGILRSFYKKEEEETINQFFF